MAKTTKKKDPTLTGYTAEKPSFMSKCIHTFKCMFNPGGKDCVKLGKEELFEERERLKEESKTKSAKEKKEEIETEDKKEDAPSKVEEEKE